MIRIIPGDCRAVLPTLESGSVQMICTSPPYYRARNYLPKDHALAALEIGQEATPEAYIAALVDVFRLVRPALHDTGTIWINIGDCYASSSTYNAPRTMHTENGWKQDGVRPNVRAGNGLKPKDLVGIPWMLAFALRSDGWYLRADNVWGKPNGMPDSCTDRTTRAHEYVFLLSKKERYYYDHEAVRTAPKASTQTQLAKPYLGESTKDHNGAGVQNASDIKRRIVDKQRKPPSHKYVGQQEAGLNKADIKDRYYDKQRGHSRRHAGFNERWDAMERAEQIAEGGNLRSVWWISPARYREAHFAVMPAQLAEICIRAGSRPGDTVLDPFSGVATTALVADQLGRHAIGCELNEAFVGMGNERVTQDAGLFADLA